MCFKGKIGKNIRLFQDREITHDQTNVETLRDVKDLLPPLSPDQHSGWRDELHKAAKMRHTYFATQIVFFRGLMRVIR